MTVVVVAAAVVAVVCYGGSTPVICEDQYPGAVLVLMTANSLMWIMVVRSCDPTEQVAGMRLPSHGI